MGIIPEDIIRAARVKVRQGRTADCNVIEGLHQRPEGCHLLGADTAEAFLQGEADSLGQTLPRSLRQFTGSGAHREMRVFWLLACLRQSSTKAISAVQPQGQLVLTGGGRLITPLWYRLVVCLAVFW